MKCVSATLCERDDDDYGCVVVIHTAVGADRDRAIAALFEQVTALKPQSYGDLNAIAWTAPSSGRPDLFQEFDGGEGMILEVYVRECDFIE